MRIGLIVAMDSEFRGLQACLGGLVKGRFPGSSADVVLRQCGIGKVNAAVGTVNLIKECHPDCIISTGLAGGIGETVDVWDAVVASETAYHDVWCGMGNRMGQVQGLPPRFESYRPIVEKALAVARGDESEVKFHEGLICTGDQFITSAEPVKKIRESFPDVLACDMESAAIAHVCHLMNVPFASIRIISDTPERVNDHARQWEESLAVMSDRSFRIISGLLSKL